MSGIVALKPTQSLRIYGWQRPLRILNWKVVSDRDDLDFKKLYALGLNEKQLVHLQADKERWIKDKGLAMDDITLVPSLKIHVTRDMHATLPQIAMLNLSSEFLQHTGVTFQDLVDAGLTLNLMLILRLNLMSWIQLGLHRDFLKEMTDVQSIALFQIPKNMVMQCVKEENSKRIDIFKI
jgi:hypothetical protein